MMEPANTLREGWAAPTGSLVAHYYLGIDIGSGKFRSLCNLSRIPHDAILAPYWYGKLPECAQCWKRFALAGPRTL